MIDCCLTTNGILLVFTYYLDGKDASLEPTTNHFEDIVHKFSERNVSEEEMNERWL